jgi:hypothetical protein
MSRATPAGRPVRASRVTTSTLVPAGDPRRSECLPDEDPAAQAADERAARRRRAKLRVMILVGSLLLCAVVGFVLGWNTA